MTTRLGPHFVELVFNASLKSFWRKQSLRKFLRQCRISEHFLSSWAAEETKRELLDRLFMELQKKPKGQAVILDMARALVAQQSFPDLEQWEDSKQKIAEATTAISRLQPALARLEEEAVRREDRKEAQRRFRNQQQELGRNRVDLEKLEERLSQLSASLGTQKAGYEFERWFFALADFFEVKNRKPYKHKGRQIDGALAIGDTSYLVELKFTTDQAGATDIDSALKKIRDKAENTMGVMVSISGFSTVAADEASGPRTPLLLLDHRHLYLILGGTMSLQEVVERVRRHASQTGEAFLAPEDFGK